MLRGHKEMRILHINCNYMGTALHQTMIEHLDKYVEENKVFCPIADFSTIVTKPNENVVAANCFNRLDRFFFYRKQEKIKKSLERTIEVEKYDLIHAYTLFTDGNTAYELSQKYHIPYVVAIRATDIEFFQYRINLRNRGIEILRNAAAVFFLSEKTKEFVLSKYVPRKYRGIIQEKTHIIPNGIDDFWIENTYLERRTSETLERIANKHIRICCVAQLIKRKNIPLLQKALHELHKNGWTAELTVIGKAVDRREYEKIIKDPYTTYLPPMKKEELITYYRNADIFVLPSRGETFGLVYAEAMSQGLPVIYTKGEGFDGQFEEGVVGFSVSSSDENELCKKIQTAVEDYAGLSKNALGNLNRFNWENICKKYKKIYETVN